MVQVYCMVQYGVVYGTGILHGAEQSSVWYRYTAWCKTKYCMVQVYCMVQYRVVYGTGILHGAVQSSVSYRYTAWCSIE